MTFEISMLGVGAVFLAGILLFTLVSGRLRTTTRRGDPALYWFGVALLIGLVAFHIWIFMRVLAGDEAVHLGPAHLSALFFYCFVKWLRSGEIVFGNNRFPRRGRAQPYWTILFLTFVGCAFFTSAIVYREMTGAL